MKKLVFTAALCLAMVSQAEICVKNGEAIAFMGDSITQQGNNPAGYVNMVMKGLEVAGVQAKKIAVGISGNKSNDMRGRLDRDVLARKDKQLPAWMTFSCGVNDVWHGAKGVPLEKYRENVSDIFDRCAAKGVKVIVLTPTMIREDPANAENQKLDGYVAWLKEEAAKRNLPVCDLNAAMKAELARIRETDKSKGNKLTADGVHMRYPGNCMMAWNILKTMGVEDSVKDAVFAAWSELPAAFRTDVSFSVKEWSALEARAKAAGKSPAAYLHDLAVAPAK